MNAGVGKNIALLAAVTAILSVSLVLSFRTFISDADTSVQAAPRSLEPAGSLPLTIDHRSVVFFVYDSQDSEDNSYSLSVPREWIVRPWGMRPGAYIMFSPMVKGTVELIKVPHGFSLEEYILTAEEPKIRGTTVDYERENFRRIFTWNTAAYQLSYTSLHNGTPLYTERTYISGIESTCVITLLYRKEDRGKIAPLLAAAVSSFRWEDK